MNMPTRFHRLSVLVKSPKTLITVMITLAAIRTWIGLKSFAQYNVDTYHDEWMMFRYSILPTHFANSSDMYAMAKNMSFPLFLNLVHFSGLPYSLVVSLIWVAAAAMAFILIRRIHSPDDNGSGLVRSHDIAALLSYVYILFMPCAFDIFVGTKLYRNAIIAPFALLTALSLLFFVHTALVSDGASHIRRQVTLGVSCGLLLGFNYYISENGVWLLVPTIILVGTAAVAYIFRFIRLRMNGQSQTPKWLVGRLLACALPFLVLLMWSNAYAAINYHFFGVYQINTRVGGEPGRFTQNIYKIASDNRTPVIWAPADAIDKAFSVSPTLQSVPELHRTLVDQNSWANGQSLYDYPLRGDFLTWSLPDAMSQAGLWKSHAQVDSFFASVNRELDKAFSDGTLKRDDRIQLSSSAGGFTWKEIIGLRPLVSRGMKIDIWFSGYTYTHRFGELQSLDSMTIDQRGLQADYMTNSFLEDPPYLGYYLSERIAVDDIQIGIVKAYKLVGIPAFLSGCAGLLTLLVLLFRRRPPTSESSYPKKSTNMFLLISMGALLITAVVINVGIAWFSSFLVNPSMSNVSALMRYYAVASVPLIALFNVLGASTVWNSVTLRVSRNLKTQTAHT